ncbi:MAG: aminotransferase class IV [Chloroflexota bacterium]
MIFDTVIVNGDLLSADQAHISIFNSAYFSSFGVYETVKVDQGRPFYLQEHFQRLFKSAAMIDLLLAVDSQTLTNWFNRLRAVDPQATWSLKMIALGALDSAEAPVVAMQALPLPSYPDSFYEQGASAVLFEGERLLPTCKSLNTLVNFMARRAAIQADVLEGLLHHNGYLTEGSRSNLFAVADGQLLTSPTSAVLSGITRDVILQAMQTTGSPVIEKPLAADPSLYEEFFVSSTSMHVMPITTIDGHPVGNGAVGPITKVAMAHFNDHYNTFMSQA